MTLVKATLKVDIVTLLNSLKTNEDQSASVEEFATGLSDIIDAYIKTATVNVLAGIPVATTGTAAAQTGATTGPGTGTLT